MKNRLLLLVFTAVLFVNSLFSQTNTFPNDGNVGIGTTNPQAPLEIRDGNSMSQFYPAQIKFQTPNSANIFSNGGLSMRVDLLAGTYESFFSQNSMSFKFNGQERLGYSGETFLLKDVPLYISANGPANTSTKLSISAAAGIGVYSFANNLGYFPEGISGKFVGGKFLISRNDSDESIPDFLVTSAGNVGIRTSTPTVALEVNGDVKAAKYYDLTGELIGSNWLKNNNILSTSRMVTINSATDRLDDDYALTIRGGINPINPSTGNGKCLLVQSFGGNLIKSETTTGIAIYGKASKYNSEVGYSGYFEGGKFVIKPYENSNYNQFGFGLDEMPNGYYMNSEMFISPFGSPYRNGTSLRIQGGYDGTAIMATSGGVINGVSYSGQFIGGSFKIARDIEETTVPDFFVGLNGNINIGTSIENNLSKVKIKGSYDTQVGLEISTTPGLNGNDNPNFVGLQIYTSATGMQITAGGIGTAIEANSFAGKAISATTCTAGSSAIYGEAISHSGGGPCGGGNSGLFVGGLFKIQRTEQSTIPDLIVNNDGNISIGTTNVFGGANPYKLTVDGKIRCTALRVTTDWADFVFEDSYKLRSLDELEQFIIQNKHLPDVPTAKTVEEQGVDVGEMQKIMLQKIEELTLYIIQQQKTMEEQQKQIAELQSLIK